MEFALDTFAHFALRGLNLAPVLLILTAIELALPRSRCSLGSRLKGAVFWILVLLATAITMPLLTSLWGRLGVRPLITMRFHEWTEWAGPASPYMAAFLAIALTDFFGYWYHRIQHGPLWRIHAVHHSVRELNAFGGYSHVLDSAFQFLFQQIPLSLLPVDDFARPAIFVLFMRFQLAYIHSPTLINYGPLRRIFVDNRYHRIHHSLEPQHFGKNFCTIVPFWDQLFGTAYFPRRGEWPDTGLADQDEPQNVRDFLLRPFQSRRQSTA